uniref:CSON009603 protein n=1 Tax=Culicoides sonorensis TaxID=179676 RepID=A0A336M0D9_CULSO
MADENEDHVSAFLENQRDQRVYSFREVLREKQRTSKRNQRLRESGLLGKLFQCRLCFAIQTPGIKYTSVRIKDVAGPLLEMYNIDVHADKRKSDRFSKICPVCKTKLKLCHDFFLQVNFRQSQLLNDEISDDPIKSYNATNEIPMKSQIVESEPEEVNNENLQGIENEDEDPIIYDDGEMFTSEFSEKSVDADLDFDFTDEEADEQGESEPKTGTVKIEETKIKEEVEEPDPECTKVVNSLMDTETNGLESQIDCCLIDKSALLTKAEEDAAKAEKEKNEKKKKPIKVKLNITENPVKVKTIENPVRKKRILIPKSSENNQRLKLKKSSDEPIVESIMEFEDDDEGDYIVCEKCKIIFNRPKNSVDRNCGFCVDEIEIKQ